MRIFRFIWYGFFIGHEILCSFIDSINSTNICRFYFKIINLQSTRDKSGESHYYNNDDVFVIAQQKPECESGFGRHRHFPHSIISEQKNNYYNIKDGQQYSKTTMFFVFILIALPFVACIASCVQNFKRLPCGLCNTIFRKSSSTYLRNVRPYPGVIVEFPDRDT
jgi:hypothetical protein